MSSKLSNEKVDNEEIDVETEECIVEKDSEGFVKNEKSTKLVIITDFDINKFALYNIGKETYTPKELKTGKLGKPANAYRLFFSYEGHKYWKIVFAHVVLTTSNGMKVTQSGNRKVYLNIYENTEDKKSWEKQTHKVLQAINDKIVDIYWDNRNTLGLSGKVKSKNTMRDTIRPLPMFQPTDDEESFKYAKDNKGEKSPMICANVVENNAMDIFNTKVYSIEDVTIQSPKQIDITKYYEHKFKCVPILRIPGGYCSSSTVSVKTELDSVFACPPMPRTSTRSDLQLLGITSIQGVDPIDLIYDKSDSNEKPEDGTKKKSSPASPPTVKLEELSIDDSEDVTPTPIKRSSRSSASSSRSTYDDVVVSRRKGPKTQKNEDVDTLSVHNDE